MSCSDAYHLTLDDRIAQALKEIAQRSNRSFEEVVNETLRAGLTTQGERKARRYVVRPASLGGPLPGRTSTRPWRGCHRGPGARRQDVAARVIRTPIC